MCACVCVRVCVRACMCTPTVLPNRDFAQTNKHNKRPSHNEIHLWLWHLYIHVQHTVVSLSLSLSLSVSLSRSPSLARARRSLPLQSSASTSPDPSPDLPSRAPLLPCSLPPPPPPLARSRLLSVSLTDQRSVGGLANSPPAAVPAGTSGTLLVDAWASLSAPWSDCVVGFGTAASAFVAVVIFLWMTASDFAICSKSGRSSANFCQHAWTRSCSAPYVATLMPAPASKRVIGSGI